MRKRKGNRMDNTRVSGEPNKNESQKRGKCPVGCGCGRHKNKSGNTKASNERHPKKQSRTEIKQNEFIAAMRQTAGIIEPALEMVGMSRSTYRKWYNEQPDFAERMDDLNEAQRDFVQTKLMKGIKGGSERLIEFYLDRRDPTFAKKSSLDITSGGEKVAPNVVFVPASDDQETETPKI